jgi:curved DNA-binding protein
MEFKDYYATLGIERTATQDEVKRAYRKLARKYHPDVSKEPDTEARFKEVAEAHEALIDSERRAAYDDIAQRHASGQPFEPPPGWDSGFEYSGPGSGTGRSSRGHAGPAHGAADFSDFFESLFGRGGPDDMPRRGSGGGPMQGGDHHAKVAIGLLDACHGAQRMISLRMPVVDATGHTMLQERQLEVHIPKGVREGQHLRLTGQGAAGHGGAPAGDLYLEIEFLPHPVFRVDGGDLSFDLPVAPWEAALGATVTAPTPDGQVQLSVPPGSSQGRKLRLKGKGLPGKVPGDLYAVLTLALPPSASESEKKAYSAFAGAFAAYNPRAALEARDHG